MEQLAWKEKLIAFSENQKKTIIENLCEIVQNGTYGKDYTVAPREKNRKLRQLYCVDDAKVKEILLSLREEDCIAVEDSNNMNHLGDVVCKFKKHYLLIPKWKEDADYESVPLYIKMVIPDVGDPLFIISLHIDE